MKAGKYLLLCVTVALVVALAVLFVPGVSTAIESTLLTFLSTNAR